MHSRYPRFNSYSSIPQRNNEKREESRTRSVETKSVSDMMAEEDRLHAQYVQYGICDGTPGSTDEDDVRGYMYAISESDLTMDEKYDALDALWTYASNNLEAGCASPVMQEISHTIDVVQFPDYYGDNKE